MNIKKPVSSNAKLQTSVRSVTKGKDKLTIVTIVINEKLEAEIHTTTTLQDANHLHPDRILFETKKYQDYETKLKELLTKSNTKIKHLDKLFNEYIIIVMFNENITTRLKKKILEYIKSDVGLMGGMGSNPFDAKTERAVVIEDQSENEYCKTIFTTSRKVMLRMAAAIYTSTATNRGIRTFREEKKEMLTNSKYDIFINIISQEGVPANKEDIVSAITDVMPGVRLIWPGITLTGNGKKLKATITYPSGENLPAWTEIVITRNGSLHISRGITVIQVAETVAWQLQENTKGLDSDDTHSKPKDPDPASPPLPDTHSEPEDLNPAPPSLPQSGDPPPPSPFPPPHQSAEPMDEDTLTQRKTENFEITVSRGRGGKIWTSKRGKKRLMSPLPRNAMKAVKKQQSPPRELLFTDISEMKNEMNPLEQRREIEEFWKKNEGKKIKKPLQKVDLVSFTRKGDG